MASRLILNADDFGLTRGVNRAIAELYQAGAITSTTLMATGPAFDHAASLAAALPGLGVGCHVVLLDGSPVSPPHEIPTLLASDRKHFRPGLAPFAAALLLGRIREEEIALEAEAQIRRLQHSGIPVTHVDTHKHTHVFPTVARALREAARRCGIPAMRMPFEPRWSIATSHAPLLRRMQLAALRPLKPSSAPYIATTGGTLGIAATGCLDAPVLRSILDGACSHPDSLYELVCHPGYNDEDLLRANTRLLAEREVERSALLQEVAALRGRPDCPRLIHFGDLDR